MSGMQYKMLLTIIAEIIGNDYRPAIFTTKKLAQKLEIRDQHVSKDMKKLIEQGLILCEDTKTYSRTYTFGTYWKDDK